MRRGGDRLNFLDLTIIRKNNGLIFDRFRKPIFSGKFLNYYYSHHSYTHKRGIVYGLIDRVILLSHPEFHKSNFIINVLLDNGYPLDLIFSFIRRRLQTRSHTNSQKSNEQKKEELSHSYFTISYVSCISKNSLNFLRTFHSANRLLLLQKIK